MQLVCVTQVVTLDLVKAVMTARLGSMALTYVRALITHMIITHTSVNTCVRYVHVPLAA